MKRENWVWVKDRPWNMDKFIYFEINDRGEDWSERYYISGFIQADNYCVLGFYKDKEDAKDDLDRMMGHLD